MQTMARIRHRLQMRRKVRLVQLLRTIYGEENGRAAIDKTAVTWGQNDNRLSCDRFVRRARRIRKEWVEFPPI